MIWVVLLTIDGLRNIKAEQLAGSNHYRRLQLVNSTSLLDLLETMGLDRGFMQLIGTFPFISTV